MYRFDTLSNSKIIFSFWCVINSFEEEEENEEDIYFAKKTTGAHDNSEQYRASLPENPEINNADHPDANY